MADSFRIKRRASGGAGPPATLLNAEIAYNEVGDVLYYGKGNSSGNATSIVPIGGAGAFLPLTGGTMTGALRVPSLNTDTLAGPAEGFAQAGLTMSGGGVVISWAGLGGRLAWDGRFLALPVPIGSGAGSAGYFAFSQPPTDIPAAQVWNGVARSATAAGVVLNSWEALYADCTIGGDLGAWVYRIVVYNVSFIAPSNWILIAVVNGDNGSIKLGTGRVLFPGETINGGVSSLYLPRAGGTVSGNLTVTGTTTLAAANGVTQAAATNDVSLATTAYVKSQGYAPLASPVFTGTPILPSLTVGTTQPAATNSTQLATTAYVKSQNYVTGGPYLPLSGGTLTSDLTVRGQVFVGPGGSNGYVMLTGGDASTSGYLSIYNPSSVRVGFLGYEAGNPAFRAEQGAFAFRGAGGVTVDGPLSVGGATPGNGYIATWPGSASISGYLAIYNPSGTRLGYLGSYTTQPSFTAEVGAFAFHGAGGVTVDGPLVAGGAAGNATSPTNVNTNLLLYNASPTNWSGIGSDVSGNMYFVTGITAPATRMRIDVSGACFNQSGTWSALSDAALKDDIQPYTRGLDALLQINPVSFVYKPGTPFANAETPSPVRFGLLAQDVEPHIPEIVGETQIEIGDKEETVSTLNTGDLVFVLINAVKELKAEIDALKAAMPPGQLPPG